MLVRAQQHHQQPAADSNSAPQVWRRQLLGAAGLLCATVGMAGQPQPAAAIVYTPDGFRSQVDRCVGADMEAEDVHEMQALARPHMHAQARGSRLVRHA